MYFNALFWHSFGGNRRGEKNKNKKKISQELQCRLRVLNLQPSYYNSHV